MNFGKRIYWVLALVAVLALAGTAITVTSQLTSAGGSTLSPSADACDAQEGPDEADEAGEEADAEADDGAECADDDDNEVEVPGQLDDGKDLLPQAGITVDAAIAAAQAAVTGDVGEIDLEDYQGKLAFNVDIGDKDVKIDASNGAVLATDGSD